MSFVLDTDHCVEILRNRLRAVIVLPFDEHAAARYGALKANLERQGQVIGELDMQIAAVTLTRGLRLVTHNQAHFARIPDLARDDWLAQRTS